MSSYRYRAILREIISFRNPATGVRSFFLSSPIEKLEQFAPALCAENFFRIGLSGTPFPTNLSKLESCGNMPVFRELKKALLWNCLATELHTKELSSFLALRNDFDHSFLLGKYETCLSLLDNCHQQFGWSLWEIEKRIVLFGEQGGIDAQNEYITKILEGLGSCRISPYLISRFGKQCERNSPFSSYLNMIQTDYNRLIANHSGVNVCQYLRYKAHGFSPFERSYLEHMNPSSLSYFLCEDDKLPLIDRYISFCTIVTDVFSIGSIELQSEFLPYLHRLSSRLADTFLLNVVHYAEEHYCPFHQQKCDLICKAYDFYFMGNYQESIQLASQLLREGIEFFPLAELYAKNAVFVSCQEHTFNADGCVLDTIHRKLRQIFSQEGDFLELEADLLKTLYIHWDTAWSHQLLLMIERFAGRLLFLAPLEQFDFYSSVSSPSHVARTSPFIIDEYMKTVIPTFQNSLSVRFAMAILKEDVSLIDALPVATWQNDIYKAFLLLRDDSAGALKILTKLSQLQCLRPISVELDAIRVEAALNAREFLQAMEVFAAAFYKNSNIVYIGHIDRIFQALKQEEYDVRDSILPSILCSIYFNHYSACDSCDDIIWKICYEEYLESQNVRRPSEFILKMSPGTVDLHLFHFLSDTCIPSIMEGSITFDSSDDVLQERILICRKLVDIAPEYRNKYEAEIQRLTKASLIQLARQKVECGKIHVDAEGLRTLLIKDVSELYEQYINLKTNSLYDFSARILSLLATANDQPSVQLIVSESRSDMLLDIVQRVRDIFVADSRYGLDGCLSVRIRHGTLESQLRSCFEQCHLVTKKMPDESYIKNDFWLGSSLDAPQDNVDMNSAFSDFSNKVDDVITHLKKDLIQIKTENKCPDGLFDFSIDANLLSVIESKIFSVEPYAPFDEFIDIVFDFFLGFTEAGLENVRNALQGEVEATFQQALKDLETNLQKQRKRGIDFPGLRDQIASARTEISTELKSVSEWFHLDQPDSYPDFPPSLALSISEGKAQPLRPKLDLHYDSEDMDEGIMLKGRALPCFVDIFNILLGNAAQHSGFSDSVPVKISVHRNEKSLTIQVENPVETARLDLAHVDAIVEQLNDWENQDYVRREGGSGLHKLKRVLSADLNCKNTISISTENNVFSIRIDAELKEALL